MRTFTRISAVISFLFCFLGGVCMLGTGFSGNGGLALVVGALGLFLIGMAFFFGAMLWLAGQKCSSK